MFAQRAYALRSARFAFTRVRGTRLTLVFFKHLLIGRVELQSPFYCIITLSFLCRGNILPFAGRPTTQPPCRLRPPSRPAAQPSSSPGAQPPARPVSQPSCRPSSQPSRPARQPANRPARPGSQPRPRAVLALALTKRPSAFNISRFQG